MEETIRKAVSAGKFYAAEFTDLQQMITDCFNHERGPGDLPVTSRKGKVLGVMAPHAGYPFSGPAAAWVYKEIGEAEFPDCYIILGVNHGSPETCSCNQDWETPFGTVRCDLEFVRALKNQGILMNNEAHSQEHSIEVQLPFLQFVSKDNLSRLKIVPIMIGDENFKDYAEKIQATIQELGRSVVIIASGDMTHYGRNYGYIPFEIDVKNKLKELDTNAAGYIQKMDAEGFINFVGYNHATICGKCTVPVMLELLKDKKVKTELLSYYTSGDITEDYKNCVGYAAIVLKE
ncbi:AmmeMemoRadiSam system protein B [Thermoproteota archaeon]